MSVFCDGVECHVLCLYTMAHVGCHVLCLQHGTPVWQHIGQSITATSRYCRDMTTNVKATLNPNKKSKLFESYVLISTLGRCMIIPSDFRFSAVLVVT